MDRIEDWLHVLTGVDCPWCVKAIDTLRDHDMQFVAIAVTPETRQQYIDAGITTVPHITVGPTLDPNSEVIGGYEGLLAWMGADI
jgi:glutaredoxin